MKAHRIAVLALPTFALTACGGRRVEIENRDIPASARWNATLATPPALAGAVQVSGSAWMSPGSDDEETRAEVRISNATPGGVHPWHVHRGLCGGGGDILGSADDYKPLKVDDDGRASEAAVVEAEMPESGEYHVNVHASPGNLESIIACGNFAPPIR